MWNLQYMAESNGGKGDVLSGLSNEQST